MIDPGGGVPSGQSQGGSNTAELLQQILSSNQGSLTELAKKASTPIPGGHSGQFPLSLQPDQRQIGGYNRIPTEGIVGRKNARAAGIGNAVIGVTHALAATETSLDNKKKLEVASATQQLLTAQSAYDQASQLYKQDPTNADAKAAMERNQSVMNGILSNDKIRKAIAKGMNIDFTDPKSNDTLEHQGVAQGKEMAKAHLSYAEQFNEKTPTTMQPNVQAQQQYQAALQERKLNADAVKAVVPLISAQLRAQSSSNRDQTMLDRETLKENHDTALAAAKSQDSWQRLNAQIQSRQDLAKTQFGMKMQEIGAEGMKEMQVFKSKLEMKTSDPMSRLTAYNNYSLKTDAQLAKYADTISKLEKDKETALLNAGGQKAEVEKSFDEQINLTKQLQKGLQDNKAANTALFKLYDGKEASNGGSSVSNSSSSSSDSISSADHYLNDDESGNDDSDDEDN